MYVTLPSALTASETIPSLVQPRRAPPDTKLSGGSYLYFEGDKVDWLFQVRSGVLRQSRLLADGRRQVIAFGFPGDIVGYPAGGRHNTDCDALSDARLRAISRSALENCDTAPELHHQLLQAALREIGAMQDHFMMLGRKSAVEKVASFLCVLAERIGVRDNGRIRLDLPMRRTDIADFLGLSTETISRTLTQLRKSGVIEIDNIQTIIVARHAELLALSQRDDAD